MVKMVPPAYPGLALNSARNYSPAEDAVSSWHTVRPGNKESLESVAQQYGVPVPKLIEFNFPGSVKGGRVDPDVVNWYLFNHERTKCRHNIGYNYVFAGGERLAIPFLGHVEVGPVTIHKPSAPSILKNVWAGVGKPHSGDFFVIGAQDLTAKVYNLGDPGSAIRNAWININGYKFGPGLGADVGLAFVVCVDFEEARDMIGVDGGWDFDVALGTKLSTFLKDLKYIGKAVETIEKWEKTKFVVENLIKNREFIHGRGIYTVPIPFAGIGLHLWAGYKFGDVTVFSQGVGVP